MLFKVNYVGVVAPVIVFMAALDDCGGFNLCSFQNVVFIYLPTKGLYSSKGERTIDNQSGQAATLRARLKMGSSV